MNCERCGKRLSRKSARQVDGVVMCSPCMFGQTKPDKLLDKVQQGDTIYVFGEPPSC